MTETFPTGAPCWIDLMTSDADRAREFYPALFGWTANEASADFGGYFMFTLDGAPVAGAMPRPGGIEGPDRWSTYLKTPDVDKAVQAATEHGAQLLAEPMDVADLGRPAVITDPGGAAIGLWQPNTFTGLGAIARPNAPGWFELFTRDYAASVAFYRDVLGWDAHTVGDTDEFRYTTYGKDEAGRAGIMDAAAFLPEGAPAAWSVYFAVEDTDAALARVSELGGQSVRAGEDTPYGRLGEALDSTGASFKLLGPNAGRPAGG